MFFSAFKRTNALAVLIWSILAFFLVMVKMDSIWSVSVDYAHHYALIARLSESWSIPHSGDPSLSLMSFYPRYSHLFAALLGHLLGSALLGMQVATLCSIVLIWGSLIFILVSLPKKSLGIASAILIVLFVINRRWLHAALFGDEIVTNYFYAQLVAQAFVLSIIAWLLSLERNAVRPALRYLILTAAVYITTGIHLLPALELLLFFSMLCVVDAYRQNRDGKLEIKDIRLVVLLLALSWGMLLLHPSFASMSQFSTINGVVTASYVQNLNNVITLSVILLVGSVLMLSYWLSIKDNQRMRQLIALKYTGIFGASVAALCLLQLLALRFGHGSEYAVRKYIFALDTMLLCEFTLALSVSLRRFKWVRLERLNSVPILIPALTVMAFFSVTSARALVATQDVVALERRLLQFKKHDTAKIPDKFDYVVGIDNLPFNIAYMMSIGLFKAPFPDGADFPSHSWWIADWNRVGRVLTSENSTLDRDISCRRAVFPDGALVLLDGACAVRAQQNRTIIDFTDRNFYLTCVTKGLSSAEDFGTWTADTTVTLRCPVPLVNGKAPVKLRIDSKAFIYRGNEQRVQVRINGAAPHEYRFDAADVEQQMMIDLPDETGRDVLITLTLPDAVSPYQLGMSEDRRQLGIGIRSLEFR
jgi:hypothetical protein